jgi:serine/threonine protein phosphatase PrpC
VPHPGDVYLLCTDGLSSEIIDPRMLEIYLKNSKDLQKACHELIEEANRNGGHDNITVVLVRAP